MRTSGSEESCENLTVDDVSDGLQTSTAYRPLVDVHFLRLPVDEIKEKVAPKVETGVNSSGNQGKRYGGYSSIDYEMVIQAGREMKL